nr:hydrogenase maturation protease [Anaerolineae bacterium]
MTENMPGKAGSGAGADRLLVLALGNPLRGDDGAGEAVLEYLKSGPGIPEHIDLVIGGTPGLELVLFLEGYSRAVIIDAAEMGLQPGEWRSFSPDLIQSAAGEFQGTLHSAGLFEALYLAESLGQMPAFVQIIGIQPEAVTWEPGLSPVVQEVVPQVGNAIRESYF